MSRAWVAAPAAMALSTSAKTLINIIAGAAESLLISEIGVSVAADSATRVTLELCESTQGAAGTSTDFTASLKQTRGFRAGNETDPGQITVRSNYTAEPTTLTVLKHWIFAGPGPFVIQFPLGREIEALLSGASAYKALALRATVNTGTPNALAYVEFEPA